MVCVCACMYMCVRVCKYVCTYLLIPCCPLRHLSTCLFHYDLCAGVITQYSMIHAHTVCTHTQAGLGALLLAQGCLVRGDLPLQPRLDAMSTLAAGLAAQYFGTLLQPAAAGDEWLCRGLAGWLAGQGLRAVVGTGELTYMRWRERAALALLDDGEALGPLSPIVRLGDRGGTAAWGRMHGTQVRCSMSCKAQQTLEWMEYLFHWALVSVGPQCMYLCPCPCP